MFNCEIMSCMFLDFHSFKRSPKDFKKYLRFLKVHYELIKEPQKAVLYVNDTVKIKFPIVKLF